MEALIPGSMDVQLLVRCCEAAEDPKAIAQDQREAHVFRMAAIAVRSRFPAQSVCLIKASERYFAEHPDERLDPATVARMAWAPSLPQLREELTRWL
jgi:hypothetical protein